MKFGVYYWRRSGSDTNPIKIGKWSGSPEKTISQYEQRGDPRPAEILAVEYSDSHKAARTLEKQRHRQFGGFRVRGEWFEADESLLSFVKELAEGRDPILVVAPPPKLGSMDKEKLKISSLTSGEEPAKLSERKKFRLSGLRWPR